VSAGVALREPRAPEVREERAAKVRVRRFSAWFFLTLLAYQSFHQLEHTIETVHLQLQHKAEADTLITGVDFEWVHFGANALLLYGLIAVVVGVGAATRARLRVERRWGWYAIVAAVVVQTYHVIDHSVRLVEYVSSGGDVPQGTLTRVVDPVWFHFGINLTVLVGMYAAFFGLGVHRALGRPRSPAAGGAPRR
jgi:hypothetical protein